VTSTRGFLASRQRKSPKCCYLILRMYSDLLYCYQTSFFESVSKRSGFLSSRSTQSCSTVRSKPRRPTCGCKCVSASRRQPEARNGFRDWGWRLKGGRGRAGPCPWNTPTVRPPFAFTVLFIYCLAPFAIHSALAFYFLCFLHLHRHLQNVFSSANVWNPFVTRRLHTVLNITET